LIFCDGSATIGGPELPQKMPRKRTEAEPAKTGRAWSPIKGLTLTERGPLQVQARVRRTWRPAQTKTFESVAEAEASGCRRARWL